MALLEGPLSSTAEVTKQGLSAIRNLAVSEENRRLLGAAGACNGE